MPHFSKLIRLVVAGAAVALATAAHAGVVVTQIEARARPEIWLLNLAGQNGVAHTQVFNDHNVSAVSVFDASSLSGVDVAYLSPSQFGKVNLTAAEITALDAFVTGGGRMVVAADIGLLWAGDWAALAANFNVSYGAGAIFENPATVSDFSNPITNGPAGVVNSFGGVAFNDGLASTNPNFSTLATWATGEAALGYLPHGAGDIVWLTDFNTFDDSLLGNLDNNILWTNLFAVPAPCPADLDGSGIVDTVDLLSMLGAWGTENGDVTGDGMTDVVDLLAMLGAWGPCG